MVWSGILKKTKMKTKEQTKEDRKRYYEKNRVELIRKNNERRMKMLKDIEERKKEPFKNLYKDIEKEYNNSEHLLLDCFDTPNIIKHSH